MQENQKNMAFQEIQKLAQNTELSLTQFWQQLLESSRYQKAWLQNRQEGKLELEMWRFLLGSKRYPQIEKWEKQQLIQNVLDISWQDILKEIPWIRIKAIRVLQKSGALGQLYALIIELHSEDWKKRKLALQNLGKEGEKAEKALPIIIQKLQDPNKEVRFAAAQTLGKIGLKAQAAIPALKQTLKGPYLDVAQIAKKSLVQLQKEKENFQKEE